MPAVQQFKLEDGNNEKANHKDAISQFKLNPFDLTSSHSDKVTQKAGESESEYGLNHPSIWKKTDPPF